MNDMPRNLNPAANSAPLVSCKCLAETVYVTLENSLQGGVRSPTERRLEAWFPVSRIMPYALLRHTFMFFHRHTNVTICIVETKSVKTFSLWVTSNGPTDVE